MHGRMDRPLFDRYPFRHCFPYLGRQHLASASDAPTRYPLWDRYRHDAVLHYAPCVWYRAGCIKNVKSAAGENAQLDEPHFVWRGSVPVRIVGQPVVISICLQKVSYVD